MQVLEVLREHWLIAYMMVGFALFLVLTLTRQIPGAGWSPSWSGKPIAAGGVLYSLWWCVAGWFPLVLIMIGAKVVPVSWKTELGIALWTATLVAMVGWPFALAAYLVWKWLH
ncbi:hypothetical protein [Pandoraea communis]|uniref:hypothetical protein n=1 Tax=Pandoraea communis TaxID=2508297 RepID=UPI0025A5B0C5|nr:hypothetical protein [Pandoraea communis]MDM8359056.1 hypothetical protein [Pandoraea communis]